MKLKKKIKPNAKPTPTTKLSFSEFDEEKTERGPKFTKTTILKKEKKERAEKQEKKAPAPPSSPAPSSKPISPTAYLRSAVTVRRHGWVWTTMGELAECRHQNCTAKMHFVKGIRGGLDRYYTIGSDKSQLRTVGPCPAMVVKG